MQDCEKSASPRSLTPQKSCSALHQLSTAYSAVVFTCGPFKINHCLPVFVHAKTFFCFLFRFRQKSQQRLEDRFLLITKSVRLLHVGVFTMGAVVAEMRCIRFMIVYVQLNNLLKKLR